MRLLVTGGCGFIGSNFIRHVLAKYKDIRIINLDKLTYCGSPENLKDIEDDTRYRFVKGDICDASLAADLVGETDAVVNFAAETHVDRSIKYPDDFLVTNVYGTKTLLETAKRSGISRFIQIGTDEVYGSVGEGFSGEDDPLKPSSPYSATKAAADLLALSYFMTFGLPVTVVRSSNNFGPYQYPEKVLPLFITNLIDGKKVPLYGDGLNAREWLFVEDNCAAIDMVLFSGRPGEIYNIGGGNCMANLELTQSLLKVMSRDLGSVEHVTDRPGHDRRYALDSSKIRSLGWKPKGSFADDLKKTVDWYRENEWWWRPIKERAEIIKW